MARQFYVSWKSLDKKEKKSIIIKNIILLIFFGLVVVTYVFYGQIFNSKANGGVFDESFKPDFLCIIYRHIPNMIASIQIIVWALIAIKIIRFLMGKVLGKSKKSLTVAYMLSSLLKWVIFIVAFLFILSAWGVDTSTLLASAGILTLVIGLGAQSLITDVLAGIFLVFEEIFEVGDIVVFDGYRGTVKSIGIRTVELEDPTGDIKYINNSEIKQIINKTKKDSVARCVINIEYGQDIPKVEAVLKENLPEIGKKIAGIKEGPTYLGVSELGSSGLQLLIIAKCYEGDVYGIQREMNKHIKMLFDEHGINIPFNQIVVHQKD